MDFLTPGEKIKALRKRLKMKQQDLADPSIARAFISMIESGKRGVSKETAKILYGKFAQRAQELGVELVMDERSLLYSPEEEAFDYCLKQLQVYNADLDEIFNIAKEYNLSEIEARAYAYQGDERRKENRFIEAFVSYSLALDIFKSLNLQKDEAQMYNLLGYSKYVAGYYIESLSYFTRAYHYVVILEDRAFKRKVTYNTALCLKKLNKPEEAILYIDECLNGCDREKDLTTYINIQSLKANCLFALGDVEASIQLYHRLVDELNGRDLSLLSFIYSNLGENYAKLRDTDLRNIDLSLEFFSMAEEIRRKTKDPLLPYTLIGKANLFTNVKRHDEAISILQAILPEQPTRYSDYVLRGYKILAEIYEEHNDVAVLDNTYIKIITSLEMSQDEQQLLKMYNKVSIFYLKQGRDKEALVYMEKMNHLMNYEREGNNPNKI